MEQGPKTSNCSNFLLTQAASCRSSHLFQHNTHRRQERLPLTGFVERWHKGWTSHIVWQIEKSLCEGNETILEKVQWRRMGASLQLNFMYNDVLKNAILPVLSMPVMVFVYAVKSSLCFHSFQWFEFHMWKKTEYSETKLLSDNQDYSFILCCDWYSMWAVIT